MATRQGFDLKRKGDGEFARPRFINTKKVKIGLMPGYSLDDHVIQLGYKSSAYEILSFPKNPIVLSFNLWEDNTEKSTADADKDTYKALDKTLTRFDAEQAANTVKRLAYINPFAVAQTFFQGADTTIDNYSLASSLKQQGNLDGLYSCFTKYFMTQDRREEHYGISERIQGSWDEKNKVPDFDALRSQVSFAVADSTHGNVSKTVRTCYEGVPFLSAPRNPQLQSLLKSGEGSQDMNWIVLKPGTEILFTFRRREPRWAALEQVKILSGTTSTTVDKSKIHSDAPGTEELHKYDLKITDLFVEAEVCILDEGVNNYKRFKRNLEQETVQQVFDTHNTTVQQIPPNQTSVSLKFDVAAGCAIAYLAMAHRDNLYYGSASKHYNTFFTPLPAKVESVRVYIGNEDTLWQDGLVGLNTGKPDEERYLGYLAERGWLDYDRRRYFSQADQAYWGVLILDLSKLDINVAKEVRVEIKFSTPSGNGLFAVFSRVESKLFERRQIGGRSEYNIAPHPSAKV